MENDEIMPSGKFTKAQLDLLRMFSVDIPDEDWMAIRNYAKHYFAAKATAAMDNLLEENGWGEEKIEEWANARMRSSSKQQQLLRKAGEIDIALEKWEKENNISPEDYERWGKEHFRTPYKPE
jgi:hypothetical protein